MALHRLGSCRLGRNLEAVVAPTRSKYVDEGEQLHPTEVDASISLVCVLYTLVWRAILSLRRCPERAPRLARSSRCPARCDSGNHSAAERPGIRLGSGKAWAIGTDAKAGCLLDRVYHSSLVMPCTSGPSLIHLWSLDRPPSQAMTAEKGTTKPKMIRR
jgi:hypothetical protein